MRHGVQNNVEGSVYGGHAGMQSENRFYFNVQFMCHNNPMLSSIEDLEESGENMWEK